MNQPEQFERRARTRVGGGSPQGRPVGVVVVLGALLLGVMVLTARVDMPPPTPVPTEVARRPATSPTPRPQPNQPHSDLVYAFGRRYGRNSGPSSTPFLRVWDGDWRERYTLEGIERGVLSPDGTRLYAITGTEIVALDTASGDELWRVDPNSGREPRLSVSRSMALTPDGQMLALHDYEVDSATTAMATLIVTLIGTPTGKVAKTTILPLHAGASQIAFAPDNVTLYLISEARIQTVDTRTGAVSPLYTAAAGQLAAALAPDGSTLYVADGVEQIVVYDTATQTELRRISLAATKLTAPSDPFSPLLLQVSPDGGELAVLANQQSAPAIREGRRGSYPEGMRLLVLDAQTGGIQAETNSLIEGWWIGLVYSQGGTRLYLLDYGQLNVWDATESSFKPIYGLGDDGPLQSLLIGPYVAPAPRRTPLVTPTPAPTATPEPTPALLVGADPAPFAWIWQDDGEKEAVVEYRRDGTTSLVADYVLAAIRRSDQPPLLLVSLDHAQWGIFDPTTGISTPLRLAVRPGRRAETIPLLNNVVLSPDGQQIAFVTNSDPLPDDEYISFQQLVTVDLRSGAAQVLADVATWGEARSGQLTAWTAAGIYLDGARLDDYRGPPRGIWRFNPAAPTELPEQLMDIADPEANLEFNPQAQLVLYEPIPADPERAELRLRDLRSGEERVIYAGPFINRGDLLIAPDGAYVAYLRQTNARTGEVVRYDVAAGTSQSIATISLQSGGWHSLWEPSLLWSPDGATLFVRSGTLDPGYALGFRASDGVQISEIALPQWMLFSDDSHFSIDSQRMVAISGRDNTRLRLYQLQPATELLVDMPFDFNQANPDAMLSSYSRRETIVYVP